MACCQLGRSLDFTRSIGGPRPRWNPHSKSTPRDATSPAIQERAHQLSAASVSANTRRAYEGVQAWLDGHAPAAATRWFKPLRILEEIRADILALGKETEGLLGEIGGGGAP